MKRTVYIETTIVSYYVARANRDLLIAAHQQSTHELWPKLKSDYETYISALVYSEAAKGDRIQAETRLREIEAFIMLDIDEDSRVLANKILGGHGVPIEFPEDALHLAICAVNDIQILLTWNFAHLN